MSATIRTVTGPVPATELGVTMGHEHVIFDAWAMFRTYDSILDDEELATDELRAYGAAGGGAVVDCTNVGIGRDPLALARISAATGVRIVMGAGWYRSAVYPPEIRSSGVDELADGLVREIEDGVGETGIRPGLIGEIGTERGRIAAAEERVFRAAARAHRRTGVPIWTHTTNAGELALEQVELLSAEGVPPDRIVVSHVGDRISFGHLRSIAETGVYLSVDNIGYAGGGFPPDERRVENVIRLLEAGYEDRILLGGDTCTKSQLRAYGGPGYARVIVDFLPQLRERGIGEASLRRLLVENPARILAIP